MRHARLDVLATALVLATVSNSQTTQGLIYGRVTDAETRASIAGAEVRITNAAVSIDLVVHTATDGSYTFALLPPGVYQIRIEPPSTAGLQPAEVHELVLPVAGALEQPVELRHLIDAFEQSRLNRLPVSRADQLVQFYGPDLDLSRVAYIKRWEANVRILEPSVSAVIEPNPIRDLPLIRRDVFTMLATQPAVTSDSATARSLGLSANGIRPAASNFLVDGFELNNYLVSGPLVALPPESVQEYRISTNGFSAEYGRTAGYLANAVTRYSTGTGWHGLGYLYGKNEAFSANDFQNNAAGIPKPRLREYQGGYQIGGPLLRLGAKTRFFVSSGAEFLNSQGERPELELRVPSTGLLQFLRSLPATNPARILLEQYAPPSSTPILGDPFVGVTRIRPPVNLDRSVLLNRLDGVSGNSRYFLRLINARLNRPEFIWSPYPDFISPLHQATDTIAGAYTLTPSPRTATEFRLGYTSDSLVWGRSHPEIPTLAILSGNAGTEMPILPGSPAAYSYSYKDHSLEVSANSLIARRKYVVKFGGAALRRSLATTLPYAQSAQFTFLSISNFAISQNPRFYPALDKSALSAGRFELPQFSRQYKYLQTSAFIQQSIYWGTRFVTHLGGRFEDYGPPVNVGPVKDTIVQLGAGARFVDRLGSATLVRDGSGDQRLYDPRGTSLAVRTSFALDLSPSISSIRHTVLRGGYGVFDDRALENAWLNVSNNSFIYPAAGIVVPTGTNFLKSVPTLLASIPFQPVAKDFPSLTMVQPDLPNGYAQDVFLKLQRQVTDSFSLDTGLQASLGRRLLTTDVVNRNSNYNAQLPDIAYISSQGSSNYFAWATSANYRSTRVYLSIAYTWAHVIDNQSDSLSGNFFDLSFSVDPTVIQQRQGFSQEFNSRIDRGNADFDQRHNLAVASVWDIPGLRGHRLARVTQGWKVSQLAAFRSGFPFTVIDAITEPAQGSPLLTRRADLINPAHVSLDPSLQGPGGKTLLNADAFCRPQSCITDRSKMGNTGRNAFVGPGLFSIDVALAKTFAFPWLGEAGRISIRADAFNFLNHPNLNPPESNLTSNAFGFASFGRLGKNISFPAQSPFQETARQVQVLFRLEF